MHNLISHNQLAGWKQSFLRLENTLDRTMEEAEMINDYYDCLIECDDDQATCKRICRRILEQSIWRVDYPPFFMQNRWSELFVMDVEKVKLIVRNMESLISLLKIEIGEETNVVPLDELISGMNQSESYEPDYYEEP